MLEWLQNAIARSQQDLPEDFEGYLLGRGVRESAIAQHGLGCWDSPSDQAPDPKFVEKFGSCGERLNGLLIRPLWNGKGDLLGMEARDLDSDKFFAYFLDKARWNPIFIGLRPDTMEKIWEGASVWLTTGGFDVTVLEHIVPDRDVVLGTGRPRLTYSHSEFFRRFLSPYAQVNLVFSRDDEGRKGIHGAEKVWGALRSLDRVKVRNRDIPYRGGKDPCEIWERFGTPGLREAFSAVL
jgi:hypothetical protein